ncbi:hypothetical protein Pmani_015570 [Petrolisthes manimaculis]|uniref:Protein zwilch n=1 Tax=Petrolisthes manimaculis TaxID=1843537 RepID=A0AAE1PTI2_9EUCA|nr:hypothetical protein Pmani_015570 [Petrolisthes manimaculis]
MGGKGTYEVDQLIIVLKRLLLKESEDGEYAEVGGERLMITLEHCPPMLLSVNKDIQEIILVQQYSQVCKKSPIVPSFTRDIPSMFSSPRTNGKTPSNAHTDNNDLDVTGSPLKCPFMQDMGEDNLSPFIISLPTSKKKEDQTLRCTPIPACKVWYIASKFNLAGSKLCGDVDKFVPLWVVCDGKDEQGTHFVGMHREEGNLSRTLVRSSGPYQGVTNLPSLDHLILHHTSVGRINSVESVVEATYDVLTSGDEDRGSSLRLICNWKRPLAMLSPPAPHSRITASIRVVCDDVRCAAHQMYLELSVLRGFVSGLVSGEVAWFIRQDSSSITNDIQQVFEAIKDKGVRQKRDDDTGNNLDMMIEGKFLNRRKNMDFTDHLWNVLLKCESYQELKETLAFVFMSVASAEVRPQILACNTTQVGTLLRNIMQGKESVPQLSGLTPLHMLIEIGCEKIKRDYIDIFKNGELTTCEQLSWFVSSSGGNSGVGGSGSINDDIYQCTIDQLGRLHVALQVVVALRTYLSLPPPTISHFTVQVLNQMKEVAPGNAHSFSLQLQSLCVRQLFNSLKINSWEVNVKSSEASFSKLLRCYVSRTPLIQLSSNTLDDPDDLENEKDDCDEENYYCSYFSCVTDKYFS